MKPEPTAPFPKPLAHRDSFLRDRVQDRSGPLPEDPEETPEDPNLRQLRQKADRADELESEIQELRKQVAITNAGLTGLTPRQARSLAREDDVDWEDPESIRSTATELGYFKPEPAKPPDATDAELAGHERVEQAAAGAGPSTWDAVDAIASAKTPEEVIAAATRAGVPLAGDND